MKDICLKYGLPIWDNKLAFELLKNDDVFLYNKNSREFFIVELKDYMQINPDDPKTLITEQQFIKLLEDGI